MKFILEVTLNDDADPDSVADSILNHLHDTAGVEEVQSYDGIKETL